MDWSFSLRLSGSIPRRNILTQNLVVVKQEFFRNRLAQGAVHHSSRVFAMTPPEPLLGRSMIPVLINGALNMVPWIVLYFLTLYICRQRTTYSMRTLKVEKSHNEPNKIRIVSSKRLGAGHVMPFWSPMSLCLNGIQS